MDFSWIFVAASMTGPAAAAAYDDTCDVRCNFGVDETKRARMSPVCVFLFSLLIRSYISLYFAGAEYVYSERSPYTSLGFGHYHL